MGLILIIVYLAILLDIYLMADAVINIGYYFNKY